MVGKGGLPPLKIEWHPTRGRKPPFPTMSSPFLALALKRCVASFKRQAKAYRTSMIRAFNEMLQFNSAANELARESGHRGE
jgi:hypothetical protein